MSWGFYGRARELEQVRAILARRRWFFARITGRRRIGKTTLVQRALTDLGDFPMFYVQIPDSAAAGVLSAVADAMDTFGVDPARFPRPDSLLNLARTIQELVRAGYLVALDEFQYFSRKHIYEFTSHLQAVVDDLSRQADQVPGGLIVLGSLHTELVALLEDRQAPLYNRTTDQIELDHLDIASVLTILRTHADPSPERLLFLWNLFEGVPEFYRDCFEQNVLAGHPGGAARRHVLPLLVSPAHRGGQLVSERAAGTLRRDLEVRRPSSRLISDLSSFDGHIARFIAEQRAYQSWTIERVAIAPRLSAQERSAISRVGYIPQDLVDLTQGL